MPASVPGILAQSNRKSHFEELQSIPEKGEPQQDEAGWRTSRKAIQGWEGKQRAGKSHMSTELHHAKPRRSVSHRTMHSRPMGCMGPGQGPWSQS